jgi:hypothetical protein
MEDLWKMPLFTQFYCTTELCFNSSKIQHFSKVFASSLSRHETRYKRLAGVKKNKAMSLNGKGLHGSINMG